MTPLTTICSQCFQAIPPDAPGGLCPRCLVVGGLGAREKEQLRIEKEASSEQTVRRKEEERREKEVSQATVHIVIPEDAALPGGAPRRLGKYELLAEIARGGMGIIYKARHSGLDRVVALKMIRSGVLASGMDVERFQREARAAARLQHPNIVNIHDIGEQDGQHYLSMDYVAGANLAELARVKPFSPKQAAEIAAGVAAAIQYAHGQGVLHRDIKPSNVILTPDQTPRVLDFGLARLVTDDSQLTVSGTPLGSPCYMPPEQAAGRIGAIDSRSDVYSLGALLYELLTGRPPFQAATAVETLRLVLETEPVPPRRFNAILPVDLETICLKCLEKEPKARYASAQELGEELGRFLHDQPIHARPVTRTEMAWRWCRRNPAVASLSAATVLLLLTVAIGSPIAAYRINRTAQQLRRTLYVADMGNAWHALQDRNFSRARDLIEPYNRHQTGEEDLRGFEWRLIWDRSRQSSAQTLHGHNGTVNCVVFSPDGTWLASGGGDRTVVVWDWATQRRVKELGGFEDYIDSRAICFSPEGRLLAAKGGTRLRVWRTDTWQEVIAPLAVEDNWNGNNAVVFSPDGSTLATRAPDSNGNRGVTFWDTKTWQRTDPFLVAKPVLAGWYSTLGTVLAYSSDGQVLAASDWEELQIRDARHPAYVITNLVRQPADKEARILSVAVSANYVAVSDRHGILTLWRRGTWKQVVSVKVSKAFPRGLAFSPDGSLLAIGDEADVVTVWDVESMTAKPGSGDARLPRNTLRGHTNRILALAFAPNGRTLASAGVDGTVKLWSIPPDSDLPNLPGSDRPIGFSADGKVLAALNHDGWAHLWNVASRRDLGRIGGEGPVGDWMSALGPTGQHLALGLTDGSVQLWQVSPPVLSLTLPGDGNLIKALAFSPDPKVEQLLVVSRNHRRRDYRLYNLRQRTSKLVTSVAAPQPIADIVSFSFSSDGRRLAVIDDKRGLILFDRDGGTEQHLGGESKRLLGVAFSPDGTLLASAEYPQSRVWLWDPRTGRRRPSLDLGSGLAAWLAFTPDSKTLVTCDFEDNVRFWNLALNKEILSFPNHKSTVGAWFPPTGNALALLAPANRQGYGGIELYALPSLEEIAAIESTKSMENSKP